MPAGDCAAMSLTISESILWTFTPHELSSGTALLHSPTYQNPRQGTTMQPSEDDRRFYCPVEQCGRGFNRKYTLTEHMKTHTGDKPHVCRAPGCCRRFATSSNLARHMRLHGPLPLIKCPRDGCSRSFLSDVQLAKHLKQHDAPRTHPCKVTGCTKVFSTTGNLNRHLKKHLTEGKREQLARSSLASWGIPRMLSPTGVEQDYPTGVSAGNIVDVTPAPIDRPCDEPWSPETLEILGHMLLS